MYGRSGGHESCILLVTTEPVVIAIESWKSNRNNYNDGMCTDKGHSTVRLAMKEVIVAIAVAIAVVVVLLIVVAIVVIAVAVAVITVAVATQPSGRF